MKEIAIINELIFGELIDRVEDKSTVGMQRARVYFKNGHELSVIRGFGSHGGDDDLFEIMPSDDSFFDEEDEGDTVLGYLTPDRVNYYINKIANI